MPVELSNRPSSELVFAERQRIVLSLNSENNSNSGNMGSAAPAYSKSLIKEYEATGNGTEHSGLWAVQNSDDQRVLCFFSKILKIASQRDYTEKSFYTEIAKSIELERFRVPQFYGERACSNGDLEILLEYCDGYAWVNGLEDKIFAAKEFGKFSGVMSANTDYYSSVKLNKTPGCRAKLPTDGLEGAADIAIENECEKNRIQSVFKQFVSQADTWQALYFQCPETLIHADANDCNLLVNRSRTSLLVVDWGQIALGRVGEDLCRICAPWFVLEKGVKSISDLKNIESVLFSAYVSGVQEICAEITEQEIRLAYHIRSVSFGLSICRFYSSRYRDMKNELEKNSLRDSLASYIYLLEERASNLISDHRAVA